MRVLVLGFTVVLVWRLMLLGLDTYRLSHFSRPPVTSGSPSNGAPVVTDHELAELLRDTTLPGGVVGVYVRHLGSGATAGVNADRRFVAASLFKLPVLIEVFKQQRLKRFSWDDELTIRSEHWTDGAGVLQARVGESLTIGELTRLMIAESDNIAANVLIDHLGVDNINATSQALGLRATRVVDRNRENAMPTTSPEDMGRLLELIATGGLVDAPTSEEAVRLLEVKQKQDWLGAGLPWWGKLAHKWGDLPRARHDAGIVFTPRNQIVIVVLTENGSPEAAAEQIRSISRKVVAHVEGPGP